MSLSGKERCDLFCRGNVQEVKQFLKDNPTWDVNDDLDLNGWTALHIACFNGHCEIVSVLVAHPNINVNSKTNAVSTPFFLGCYWGHVEAVKVLLRDHRVDINMPEDGGRTPLWEASRYEYVEVIKWMIASGRELDLDRKSKVCGKEYTAIEIARLEDNKDAALLLEKFTENPAQCRHEVRLELGVPEALAAELFAAKVFLCDDYLRIRRRESNSEVGRFFGIASRLPMELQMLLCHRVYGSAKDNIPSRNSEPAFKHLASLYQK